jgi:UDP-GlcNAc:undecaprenyl-phosphate/decaprenyl-phosphate GlcNAc-1-phosphate transferase
MIDSSSLLLSGLLSLLLASASLFLIIRVSARRQIGGRGLEFHHTHETPIPRIGGLGLAVAFLAISLIQLLGNHPDAEKRECAVILISALAMFGLGLWDDLKSIGARRKLAGQIVIATAAYCLGIGIHGFTNPLDDSTIDLGFWALPVTVFWLVATTNLINLIDGLDGLAGGISLMLMILLTYVGGGSCASFLAAGMIGALLGFLNFNLPPARIYLGDGGAYFLGFLIGGLSLVSSQKGTILAALIAPLFVLALPILDTSLAILRRGLSGLPLFRADRGHLHHRLLKTGVARREVVIGAYIFTAFFLVLGFVVYWNHAQHLPIVIGFGVLFILLTAGKLSFTNEWFSVGRVLGNSMAMRAEIQFALAQNRWLILEGARCSNLDSLCEDTAFIARKLGFSKLRIRLDAQEKTWSFGETAGENFWTLQQKLPGCPECELEISVPAVAGRDGKIPPAISGDKRFSDRASFEIVADVLAEGWVKAVVEWQKHHDTLPRFVGKSD